MKYQQILVGGFAAALGLSACTAGQSGPPVQTTVNPATSGQSLLKLAVGTANIAGSAGLGLNVVATLRNPAGQSSVNLNTPKLTGPFTLPAAAAPDAPFYPYSASGSDPYDGNATADVGPSTAEVAGKYIGGSPQAPQAGVLSSINTTFGTSGGVYGNGFDPGNYGTSGSPASYYPYFQPFYGGNPYTTAGAVNTASNAFYPDGGPPAFDAAGNGHGATGGNFPKGGASIGVNTFAGVKPGAGVYTLAVTIQTTGSTIGLTPATASLANPGIVLPIATTGGAAPALTFDGTGDATVTNVAFSGAIVGAYVQLTDYGATDTTTGAGATGCNGASLSSPVVYTAWVLAGGAVTFLNANAPLGTTSAVCTAAQNAASAGGTDVYTGDQVEATVIGFDYNQYALQYHGKTGTTYPQSPAFPAQADISISPAAWVVSP